MTLSAKLLACHKRRLHSMFPYKAAKLPSKSQQVASFSFFSTAASLCGLVQLSLPHCFISTTIKLSH